MDTKPQTIVNCWNEWDPLKRVIVGVPDGCMIPPSEPAVECKVPIDSDMKGSWGPRPQDTVEKARAQLDYFVSVLEKRGVAYDEIIARANVDHAVAGKTVFFYALEIKGNIPEADKKKYAAMTFNGCPVHKALSSTISFEEMK